MIVRPPYTKCQRPLVIKGIGTLGINRIGIGVHRVPVLVESTRRVSFPDTEDLGTNRRIAASDVGRATYKGRETSHSTIDHRVEVAALACDITERIILQAFRIEIIKTTGHLQLVADAPEQLQLMRVSLYGFEHCLTGLRKLTIGSIKVYIKRIVKLRPTAQVFQ